MPLAGKDQRGRASAHYKWAERYNRYGDAHRSASHFGRALYYTTTGANFGGNSNCPQGKLCTDSRGEHLKAFAHDCAFGPMCTRDNDHHVKTMHLLNLHRANGVTWSADEHYGRCGQSCGCCAVVVDGATSGNCALCSYAMLHRDTPQPEFTKEQLEVFHEAYKHKDPPLKRK